FDDGESWEPLPAPPEAEHIYALLETEEGVLYAGGTRTDGSGVVYRFTGETWEEAGALGATGVYALLEGSNHVLYAGAACTDGTGRVFRSDDGGETWESSEPLGESQGVTALLEGAEGRIYAGLDMGFGRFTSYAYVSGDGGETWEEAGYLFMADAVRGFLPAPDGAVYAGGGDTYGLVFRAEGLGPAVEWRLYLPLVLRG
ncbi:MAG TPA: exo-alpha-sialidase, partial [Thermoflexia bacterium]|nr:exo-alpha-sialidase [Thermoflexia bacterium]